MADDETITPALAAQIMAEFDRMIGVVEQSTQGIAHLTYVLNESTKTIRTQQKLIEHLRQYEAIVRSIAPPVFERLDTQWRDRNEG